MLIKTFFSDTSGNFGFLTALFMTLLCGAAGLAVDLSVVLAQRATLQVAADAAALSVVAQNAVGQDTLQKATEKVFFANLNKDMAKFSVLAPVSVPVENKLRVTASATVPLTLGAAFLPHGFTVRVVAEAEKAVPDVADIALVLDTTASMQGQKIADLKAATQSLLGVFAASRTGRARFSLVPFSDYVNVGVSNRGKSWLSVPADSIVTKKNICTTSAPIVSKSGCSMKPVVSYADGVATTKTREYCTTYTYGASTTRCSDQVTTYTWSGCVGSRNAPLDTGDTQPATRYPGIQNVKCGSPITPLTSDFKALSSAVAALTVQNNTYIPAGLLWGLNMLSPTEPFTEGASAPATAPKFIVLLTDGDNSLRALYPTHGGAISGTAANDTLTRTRSNATTLALCTEAKSRGITIFTVAVGTLLPSSTSLLQACATDPNKAITTKDSAQLVKVFKDIANAMMVTRLTE